MVWKDERMKCLTETLSGIKTRGVEWNVKVRAQPRHPPTPSPASDLLDSVLTPVPGGEWGKESLILKLYAWEEAFEKLVTKLRNAELRQLLFGSISRGVVEANWTVAPFVVLLATFSSYIARLRPEAFINGTSTQESIPGLLTPEKIFVSLSLFNLLAVPLTSLPYMASLIIMATLAYTSQSAWIQHQSLRENILFGAPYDSALYAAVVEACQLEEDIRHLPEGDATMVGERGLTLSGGQKQRVALARAVYQQRDIYLLDDPLAAVDVHVGQRLFERVIGPRGILKDRTRIFVTNAYQWLSSCDRVLVLDNGSVAHFGTFRELQSSPAAKYLHSLKHPTERKLPTDNSSVELQNASEKLAHTGTQLIYCPIPNPKDINPSFKKYSSSWHSAPVTYASFMRRQCYSMVANSLPKEELLPPVSCFQVDESLVEKALAVETLSDLLRQNYDGGDGQPTAQDLIELMGHCLKTFFTFEGTTYEQIKGTPMGSPISGLIAEAVLQKLERRLLEFWARYVDDTFVIIDQDEINFYAEVLNSIVPDLQFTMEEEAEDKLPFLDVLVCRQPNGELATSVYRKPTNTLQILSYNSNHPPQHKRSCVRTLYRRVETHFSTPAAKLNEIKLLRELFRANGYPRAFIERSRRQPKKRNEERSQPNSWRRIPYIKGVSEVVARSLAPLGIGVAHRPDSTIRRQVMRPKDPIPKQEMSAVVYRLQCSCGSCNYVGETGRRLQTRMHEHKLAVRRLDPKSDVANHAAQMGHIFNFDAVEIVGRGSDHTTRQVHEAWMSTDSSVNRHINLPPPYLTLRPFLAGDSHGAGQSGPSVITAADGGDPGHGDMRDSGEYTQKTDPAQVAPGEDSACTAEFENETDFRETNLNEEEILQGRVSFKAYAIYVLARGVILTLISVVSYSVFSGIMAFSNKWLQNFADDKDFTAAGKILIDPAANQSARYQAAQDVLAISHHYLSIYSWLGLVLTLFICVFVMTSVASSFKASKDLHRRMLARVLRAPCYFFDTTPQGRILNRFSFDIDNIDHNLQYSIRVVFSYVVDTVVTLLIVFITIRPWYFSLGSFVIFSALYISIQAFYLPISRQSRRLNSVTKSPLLAHCSETAASLLGASVVRAHGKVEEFVAAADRLIDNNALFFYIRSVSNRWLDFRLDMLNCLFLTFTTVLTVAMREEMPPGMAGFLISYVLAVPDSLSWLVKMTAQLESSAVAIERVKEYMEIEQEAAWASGPGSPPPPDWPSACCAVELIDATVKYMPQQREQTDDVTSAVTPESLQAREKSTALRRVNLKLSGRPDERVVGIVGRTGAGKSTLAAALFRLVEAERDCSMLEVNTDAQGADHRPGPIFIDNVDISKLGLHEVRSRFSILPQDPVLFTGTLRFNLDPFGVLGDADLWRALEKAHLGDWVHSLPAGLDHHCGESGSALSAGQKQLICLARVLLSCGGRVRLLVLDEATSAMDPNTDRLVMSTLLSDVFRDATILIIAHRLSTIMTADRVIVMSHGRVVESGRPEELLQDPNSLFSGMHAHADEA
nr:unnamed protein product [Spirometra erinaceieuropaei]